MSGRDGAAADTPGDRRKAAWLAGTTLAAYLLFVAIKLVLYHGDVSRFVVAGDRFFDVRQLAYPIAVEQGSDGYDGQFYYRLALDPATRQRTAGGITIDSPPVRAQRIGYPALAWLASGGGDGRLVPYALVGLNLVALAAIAWLGSMLATALGATSRAGLLFAFYPGFVLTLARDTTEIVATGLALAALVLGLRGRLVAAGVVGAAAVLTRETTLLYLAGFGLVEAWRCLGRRRVSAALVACLLPPLAYLGWQAALHAVWGAGAVGDVGAHDFGFPPLVDYVDRVRRNAVAAFSTPLRYRHVFDLVAIVATGLFVVGVSRVAVSAPRAPATAVWQVPWGLYALMAAGFTDAVWNEPYGYLRILCDGYLIGVALILAARRGEVPRSLARGVAVLWAGTALFAL